MLTITPYLSHYRKFLRDAAISVTTAASASFIISSVPPKDIDTWIVPFAFVAQPSSDMIREVTSLLQGSSPSRTTYLSISTLVHSYCRQNDDCEWNQDVKQVRFGY